MQIAELPVIMFSESPQFTVKIVVVVLNEVIYVHLKVVFDYNKIIINKKFTKRALRKISLSILRAYNSKKYLKWQ